MKEFTSEEIQAEFEKLPKEVQDAVTSADVNERIQAVARKHGLLVDQLGELVDEIGLVMLGFRRSSDFVSDISSRLSINRTAAEEIAQEVNTQIFNLIKDHLREIESMSPEVENSESSDRQSDISAVERAGDFSIQSSNEERDAGNRVTSADKNSILRGIENPKPVPDVIPLGNKGPNSDPLVDHLLSGTVSIPEQKIVKNEGPKPSEPSQKKYETDPYHEPIA